MTETLDLLDNAVFENQNIFGLKCRVVVTISIESNYR